MRAGNQVLVLFKRRNIVPACIFDVGANVGQSTVEFASFFPEAKVLAFEPVAASYDRLKAAAAENPNISCHRLVFSRVSGEAEMVCAGTSPGNRIATARDIGKHQLEKVPMVSGDDFCRTAAIDRIDYLKIDAEGHDLDVLVGFSQMFRAGAVQYVQVECSLSPDNHRHVSYERLANVMFAFGYRLFGLFDLMRQRKTIRPGVFYGNAVFVHDPV